MILTANAQAWLDSIASNLAEARHGAVTLKLSAVFADKTEIAVTSKSGLDAKGMDEIRQGLT